jgi:hypothetical protein
VLLQALSQDLLAASLEIPFSVPPYMSLLARAVATLEGIALTGDPGYQMVAQVHEGSYHCHTTVFRDWFSIAFSSLSQPEQAALDHSMRHSTRIGGTRDSLLRQKGLCTGSQDMGTV